MTQVFRKYAKYYDLLYKDKDYELECNLIEESFKISLQRPAEILDIGCGTGNHLTLLAKRGYRVTGIDASPAMIEIARRKLADLGLEGDVRVMDVRELRLDKLFDACICMFAVIGYLTENQDLQTTFRRIREHLRSGAPLFMDFWYGPAVRAIKPSPRIKKVATEDTQLIRHVTPEMEGKICRSHYHVFVTKDETVVDEFDEVHTMRFFFQDEIENYLSQNGFRLVRLRAFPDTSSPATENTWNASVLAQAI